MATPPRYGPLAADEQITSSASPQHAQRHSTHAFFKGDELLTRVEHDGSGKALPSRAGKFAQAGKVALGDAGTGLYLDVHDSAIARLQHQVNLPPRRGVEVPGGGHRLGPTQMAPNFLHGKGFEHGADVGRHRQRSRIGRRTSRAASGIVMK
jgi:hypothetical protein